MFSCLWQGRRCLIEVVVSLCMTGRGPLDMHPIGGGGEGGVPDHHVGGPFRVSIRDFIPHKPGVPLDPPPTLDHPWA